IRRSRQDRDAGRRRPLDLRRHRPDGRTHFPLTARFGQTASARSGVGTVAERIRIGIDLGGTKTEILAIDRAGRELTRHRVATPREDYAASIRQMTELVARVESETGRSGTVGVAIPGSISKVTGLIKNANSVWLNGKPLDRDLSGAMGREVRC